MDIVYICRSGDNEELRYSLRSTLNIPHDKLWIFGDAPSWFKGNLVRTPQNVHKKWNAYNALREACLNNDVSDDFILMNDDFFCMKPVKSIPICYKGTISEVYYDYLQKYPNSKYTKALKKTAEHFVDLRIESPLSYELHIPIVYNKEKLIPILRQKEGREYLHERSIYSNVYNLGGEQMDDVKVYHNHDDFPQGAWLSSMDGVFEYLAPLFRYTFPKPSKYER